MGENIPIENRVSVTQQMPEERYRAMEQAKAGMGPAIGQIALERLAITPGQFFISEAHSRGVEQKREQVRLEQGNVAMTLTTPADAPDVRLALYERTEEILEGAHRNRNAAPTSEVHVVPREARVQAQPSRLATRQPKRGGLFSIFGNDTPEIERVSWR